MRKFVKVFSAGVVGASLLSISSLAQAQELTLRLEPGLAIPLTDPQAQRFGVGGALAVKPEVSLDSYWSVGPSVSVVALPSSVSGVNAGTAWSLGAFGRFKRPHDENNTGKGFSAISPWVDAGLQYVSTGPLDRLGFGGAVGASMPTDDDRDLWIGPFVGYQGVFQEDKPGYNSNSAKILIVGVNFEFGAKAHKKNEPVTPTPCPEPLPVQTPPVAESVPEKEIVVYHDVVVESRQVVHFAWDSPVLNASENAQLTEVAKKLASSKDFKSIRVEGHASSEGQVKHNDILSQKRAQAVVDFLAANGIPREKLTAAGYGSSVPVAVNSTEVGRVSNRRAEFVVNFVVVKESK